MAKWTVVQHSGHRKPGFGKGLEEAQITRKGQAEKITAAGGLVFDDYKSASRFCDNEQYQPDNQGLYPRAPGSFSTIEIDGRALYIPVKQ